MALCLVLQCVARNAQLAVRLLLSERVDVTWLVVALVAGLAIVEVRARLV